MRETMFSRQRKFHLTAFFVSASLSGVICYASTSEAFWTRQDGNYCDVALGGHDNFSNGCNTTTAGSIVVFCPVADSSTHPKTSITTFNVHIDDQSPFSGLVGRCVNFWAAVGGSCGSFVFTSNGVLGWSPPTFGGWTAADFGYVNVVLPPRDSANSCIKGYFTAG
jgi:hypothetical protein